MKKEVAAMSFHMVLRSRVKKQLKSIAALPEEILFNILLLLPADVLYDVMRFVCRQCYIIINHPAFVNIHSLRASSVLLVQGLELDARFLLVGERDIKISDIKFHIPGPVISSCNGLTLVHDDNKFNTTHKLYHITNPVTNRTVTLPKLPWIPIMVCSLAFTASSNTYKVVARTIENLDNLPSYYGCRILTVGVDRAWRFLNYADILADNFPLVDPVMGKGFLYWGNKYSKCILALNIESERFTTISVPEVRVGEGRRYFLPNRNTVSYIHYFRDFSISVWMLKDHETGDWVRIRDFNVEVTVREAAKLVPAEVLRSLNDCFIPLCWLDEEKILFGFNRRWNIYFSYDIKTCATRIFEMERHLQVLNHLNSLTWL